MARKSEIEPERPDQGARHLQTVSKRIDNHIPEPALRDDEVGAYSPWEDMKPTSYQEVAPVVAECHD